jgi:hypothetical protein
MKIRLRNDAVSGTRGAGRERAWLLPCLLSLGCVIGCESPGRPGDFDLENLVVSDGTLTCDLILARSSGQVMSRYTTSTDKRDIDVTVFVAPRMHGRHGDAVRKLRVPISPTTMRVLLTDGERQREIWRRRNASANGDSPEVFETEPVWLFRSDLPIEYSYSPLVCMNHGYRYSKGSGDSESSLVVERLEPGQTRFHMLLDTIADWGLQPIDSARDARLQEVLPHDAPFPLRPTRDVSLLEQEQPDGTIRVALYTQRVIVRVKDGVSTRDAWLSRVNAFKAVALLRSPE